MTTVHEEYSRPEWRAIASVFFYPFILYKRSLPWIREGVSSFVDYELMGLTFVMEELGKVLNRHSAALDIKVSPQTVWRHANWLKRKGHLQRVDQQLVLSASTRKVVRQTYAYLISLVIAATDWIRAVRVLTALFGLKDLKIEEVDKKKAREWLPNIAAALKKKANSVERLSESLKRSSATDNDKVRERLLSEIADLQETLAAANCLLMVSEVKQNPYKTTG